MARRILAGDTSPTPAEASASGYDLTAWDEAHGSVATG